MPAITRRSALRLLCLTAAACALPASARRLPTAVPVVPAAFPQGLASGDPRPDGMVLWTRLAPAHWDRGVVVQVAEDPGFEALRLERELRVGAATDGCLKLRVDGLEPGRDWHYRFVVLDAKGRPQASPPGRSRTAPAPGADRDLRFAVMSCQDYTGRWYNSLLPLLEEPLDAVIHLGDFIYETTGDPGFQEAEGRRVAFDDAEGALPLGGGRFFAAGSLDNYRQLHREYRSDPALQALLARAPLIAIWDDHEFSDDAWQDVATFHDGRRDEQDRERRRVAEQAWFEYMPVDAGGGFEGAAVPGAALHPDARIWREFRFGRRAALSLTDYRSHRPDHLVPEDAFPGSLAYDEPALRALLPQVGETFEDWQPRLRPYIDPQAPELRRYRRPLARALRRAYAAEGLPREAVRQRVAALLAAPMDLGVANTVLARHDAAAPFFLDAGPIPETPDLPRGLSWAGVGKSGLFDAIGSRYFVLAEGYGLLARLRGRELGSALGPEQADWLRGAARRHADADWRFIASSVSFTPMRLDLRQPELQAPPAWAHEVLLNVDQWDGLPVERDAWLEHFDARGAVLLSGDIHAAFAGQHRPRVAEFTVPAVSSTPLSTLLERNAGNDPETRAAGRRLAERLAELIRLGHPGLRHAQTRRNGVLVLEVGREAVLARFLELDAALVRENLYAAPERWRPAVQETRLVLRRVDGQLRLDPA